MPSNPRSDSSSSHLAYRVARRIAARRVERGLSQEGLAALLDIAVKNVQRIESGKQNLSLATLERIAAALDISPEQLAFVPPSGGPEAIRTPSVLDRLERAGFVVKRPTERGRRPRAAVPITTLRAAAGRIEGGARVVEELGWVVLPRHGAPPPGQFVAAVTGESMAPTIPSGAVCLFGPPTSSRFDGHILLVAHEALSDDELGGPYALKRVRQARKRRDRHVRVVLESINPRFAPIEIDASVTPLRVVAELVRVLVPQTA